MDETKFFEKAKELAKRNLQENLQMVEKTDSIDALTVALFGTSYSALSGFHICKEHVNDKISVTKECKIIQDHYFACFKSSD